MGARWRQVLWGALVALPLATWGCKRGEPVPIPGEPTADTGSSEPEGTVTPCEGAFSPQPLLPYEVVTSPDWGFGSGPDATSEVIFYSRATGSGHLVDGDGQGGFGPIFEHENWFREWDGFVSGQFGGDRYADLVFFDFSRGVGDVMTSDGAGQLTLLRSHTNWFDGWDLLLPGTFNDDEWTDLFFVDTDGGSAGIYLTDGSGNLTEHRFYDNWTPWPFVVAGDFGGNDDITDFFVMDTASGVAQFLLTDDAGEFTLAGPTITGFWSEWDTVVTGDFDGTGQDDLLFVDFDSGTAAISTTDGAGGFTEIQRYTNWSTAWTQVVVGDFAGSSLDDLLLYARDMGTGSVQESIGGGQIVQRSLFEDWRTDWDWMVTSPRREEVSPVSLLQPDEIAGRMGHGADNPGTPSLLVLLFEPGGLEFQEGHDLAFYRRQLEGPGRNLTDFFGETSGEAFEFSSVEVQGPYAMPSIASFSTVEEARAAMIEIAQSNGIDFAAFDDVTQGGNGDGQVTNRDVVVYGILSTPRTPADAPPDVFAIVRNTDPTCLTSGPLPVCLRMPTAGESQSLATFAHETVHALGLQAADLYADGIPTDQLTLMGSTISFEPDVLDTTTHLDPWNRMRFGWTNPRVFRIDGPGSCETLANWADCGTRGMGERRPVVLYDAARGLDEFFMLEYRDVDPPEGAHYDLLRAPWAPGGLVVWHIRTQGDGGYLSEEVLPIPGGTTTARVNQVVDPDGGFGADELFSDPSRAYRLAWLDGTDTGITLRVGSGDGSLLDVSWVRDGTSLVSDMLEPSAQRSCLEQFTP
ncbi:MAG: hypothetical protein AAGA48_04445 [Myxococcota bacterium]